MINDRFESSNTSEIITLRVATLARDSAAPRIALKAVDGDTNLGFAFGFAQVSSELGSKVHAQCPSSGTPPGGFRTWRPLRQAESHPPSSRYNADGDKPFYDTELLQHERRQCTFGRSLRQANCCLVKRVCRQENV